MLEKVSRSLVEECRGQGKSRAEAERILCDRMGMDPDLARKAVAEVLGEKVTHKMTCGMTEPQVFVCSFY